MRILVVEDEKRLAEAITQILLEKKYMVDTVYNGNDAYDYAKSGIYDCIILDIMLPGKDGYSVCSLLRKEKIDTPILMLTAKSAVSDKVYGLDVGADDYMTKPFATEELLARIRTLTRRKGEVVLDTLSFSDLTFSLSDYNLRSINSAKSIRLSYKEGEILKIFMSAPSVIISKETIITKAWGYDTDVQDNNVETYISFIRKKLAFVGSAVNIISYKKIGYRLEVKNG